jgi:hypothetical protein
MFLFLVLGLAGCGGGGGGDDGGSSAGVVSASISTVAGAGESVPIGGLQVTLHLPPGVIVKTDPQTGEVAEGVVEFVGTADPALVFIDVRYIPPVGTAGGGVKFIIVNTVGFQAGEFIHLQLDIAPGRFPKETDFGLSEFYASDLNGVAIPNLTPTLAAKVH